MSTWEDRMSRRAQARSAAAEKEQQRQEAAEQARLAVEFPGVAGENDYMMEDGPHRGHRTHMHPWHGEGTIWCSCGECMGVVCFIPSGDLSEPERCPVCIARGIPLADIWR